MSDERFDQRVSDSLHPVCIPWREIQNHMTGKSKVFTGNVTSFLVYTKCSLLLNAYCSAWQNEIQWKENSQRGKGRWMQGEKMKNIKQLNFFFMVQCHGHVPHNSVWWFPVRQAVPSQGHCFSFLYGLHEKRPFSPAAPQYTVCDPHKTVKRPQPMCLLFVHTSYVTPHWVSSSHGGDINFLCGSSSAV